MRTLIAQEGDTLDRLIYRHYGLTAGMVEHALALNPQLATMPILPMGQRVDLPDDTSESQMEKDTLQLWS